MPANVDAVVADIEAAGSTALGAVCDISNPDQIKVAVGQGGRRLWRGRHFL
jgi:hypothetical protein